MLRVLFPFVTQEHLHQPPSKPKSQAARFTLFRDGKFFPSCPESVCNLVHVPKCCIKTRTGRHDDIQTMVSKSLKKKRDFLAIGNNVGYIIDTTIVSDGGTLTDYEQLKAQKYSFPAAFEALKTRINLNANVQLSVIPLVANWRGIISKHSYNSMTEIIGMSFLFITIN
ncbi:unnamed protein product [Lepeophtheirus salmonis]|uniref:(salmon louse) hypothetical protein n=1 Tax=Lepeophtheirus salmonis TaxID=72036 RepID=A0A817FAX7_LEPSM|nr:unnamed protein product [Lepeophtheirus salmonis]CAG9476869.1 unnamed protein product [Lepeophtheirus salmonis]